MNAEFQLVDLEIPPELAGQRLDAPWRGCCREHSRTRIKGWIDAGQVRVGRAALQAARCGARGVAGSGCA